jgi:hypothetical protein
MPEATLPQARLSAGPVGVCQWAAIVSLARRCSVRPEDAFNLSPTVALRQFCHKVCQFSVDFLLPPF